MLKKIASKLTLICLLSAGSAAWAAETSTNNCMIGTANTGGTANAQCASVVVGGQTVVYPLLNWATQASTQYSPQTEAEATNYIAALQSAATVRGGFETQLLQTTAKEAASLSTQLPTNVPWVVATYSPELAKLRVDIFSIQRAGNTVSIQKAPFTPAHGNTWAAATAYISATQRAARVPGLNPFTKFYASGTQDPAMFHNISFGAARAVVGHAVRMSQAPIAVVSVPFTEFRQQQTRSGSLLRRRVTTEYFGSAVTKWYVGYPVDFGVNVMAFNDEPYCVTNNSPCPAYEVARSGLAFEEFSGGTFNNGAPVDAFGRPTDSGQPMLYERYQRSSLSLSTLVAAVFTFTAPPQTLTNYANSVAGALGVTSNLGTNLAGVPAPAVTGPYSTSLSSPSSVINGADLGTTVRENGSFGSVAPATGIAQPAVIDTSTPYGRAVAQVTAAVFAGSPETSALDAVRKTLVGDCTYSKSTGECLGVQSGVLVRKDQMAPTNVLRVWREGDRPVRSLNTPSSVYGTN